VWVAGLSLVVAAVVGVTLWLTQRTPVYHAPLTGVAPPHASPARAAVLLNGLTDAVRHHDRAAAALLGDSSRAERDLSGVVGNGAALHVTGFTMRFVAPAGGVSPQGAWTAFVHTSWRFAGFDRRAETMEVRVRFGRDQGRLGISAIGGGDRRTPLWLTGRVRVRRDATSLVLVDGTARKAARYAALARTAVRQVHQVLPAWRARLVVEVPASAGGLRHALHASTGAYADIAAVTTTVDGSTSRTAPVHVFVNPAVFDPLTTRGAQVVLTHEATHVATGGATSSSPIWLVEGFADYVALHAQRLPLTKTAARISALVHRDGVPGHLPGRAEFASTAPHLEARYESAWLACRLLAHEGGQSALVAFYRAVDAGEPVDAGLREHFGFGLAELTRRWGLLLSHLPA
jgi:hypothetical protein